MVLVDSGAAFTSVNVSTYESYVPYFNTIRMIMGDRDSLPEKGSDEVTVELKEALERAIKQVIDIVFENDASVQSHWESVFNSRLMIETVFR